ncbi:hypothetical protein KUF83_30170 [Streptomyces sp. BV286]|uniref:hypothetical protein n=1 Tax=Streptomyces sp. BV286 TaxID=2849672 RepID=UPI001C2EAB75|nr:hypothetical protein [Streptomyces sp. BV286]MBV1940803.1 hypothetical protein [Streptomyces sp. BV286]
MSSDEGGGRRIEEDAVQAGVHTKAPITRLDAQSAHLLGEAVIVMIQPDTVTVTAEDGKLLAADTVEMTVKQHGGEPLSLPPDFSGASVPGWTAHLNTENDELLIHFPGGYVFYDGTMPTTEQWRKDTAAAGSAVVITGPIATVADIESVLVSGRAHWTRIPFTIGSGPAGSKARPTVRVVEGTAAEESPKEEPSNAEAVTAAAAERCYALVREMRQHYPSVLGQMTQFADRKGAPGFTDWPDWCWVPMAGAYTVVCPTGAMLPGDPRAGDVARVAALSTWWLTKGVYWIDPEAGAKHVATAWSAPGVPAERPLPRERLLRDLPQQCVYIAVPPYLQEAGQTPPIRGVFVHLEHDYRGDRPELRLLIDQDGTWDGLLGTPVLLDRPTLLASAREQIKPEAFPGLVDDEQQETLAKLVRLAPFMVWPAVEALIDPELVISGWDLPGEQPKPATPRATGVPRWKGAAKASRWRVGVSAPRPGLRTV